MLARPRPPRSLSVGELALRHSHVARARSSEDMLSCVMCEHLETVDEATPLVASPASAADAAPPARGSRDLPARTSTTR